VGYCALFSCVNNGYFRDVLLRGKIRGIQCLAENPEALKTRIPVVRKVPSSQDFKGLFTYFVQCSMENPPIRNICIIKRCYLFLMLTVFKFFVNIIASITHQLELFMKTPFTIMEIKS
jgi:hypothetical protein